MNLSYGANGPAVAEWQLAVGVTPSGTFDMLTDKATRRIQRELGLPTTGAVDGETKRRHGIGPLYLRGIADPGARLVASCEHLTRHGCREWNALALLVTGGKRGSWSEAWLDYHAKVCGVTWGAAGSGKPGLGARVELRDGRQGIVVVVATEADDRYRLSLAPAYGAAGYARARLPDIASFCAIAGTPKAPVTPPPVADEVTGG